MSFFLDLCCIFIIVYFKMIILENSTDNFFLCSSADWSVVVKAEDEDDASRKALQMVIDKLEQKANVSPCMRVRKIEQNIEESDILIRIDKIFADMGMHEDSKSLNYIINNLSK